MRQPKEGIVTAPIPWSQLKGTLNTGDILSFEGNDGLDYAIRMVENAPYTHVGMVIRNGDDLWFWDAPGGGQTFPDPVSKIPDNLGARVADLEAVISYYMTAGGEVAMWWRQLTPAATPDQQASLMTFVKNADGTPFPGSTDKKLPAPWNLGVGFAESWAFGVKMNGTIAGTFFCAQLCAQSMMAMGLLPLSPPANAYDPASFNSSDPGVPKLQNGNTLSPTQQVSYP